MRHPRKLAKRDCVGRAGLFNLLAMHFECRGRGNDNVPIVAFDISMKRFPKSDELTRSAFSLPCFQGVLIPILAGCRTLPHVRRPSVRIDPDPSKSASIVFTCPLLKASTIGPVWHDYAACLRPVP
jgi:hypothetical protein